MEAEDSRSFFKSFSKTKKSFIRTEENVESKAVYERQIEEQQDQDQQFKVVNRKMMTRRQPVRQDPRNANGLKSRKDKVAAEQIADGAAEVPKAKVKEKTEEEIAQEREERESDIKKYEESIFYSNYYYDENYEYRHVVLPKQLIKWIPHYPKLELLSEEEWRSLGVKQSKGWVHYMIYAPEPHILLFKREINYIAKYGNEDKKTAKSKESNKAD